MLPLLILLPLVAGLVALILPVRFGRPLLVATGAIHLLLALLTWALRPAPLLSGFFALTPIGLLVLALTSFIFLFISFYAVFYIKEQAMPGEAVFIGCLLLFLSMMSMAALADHPIVLWIAIEATTLASAPLIFITRSKKALEATWKYVLICSVGIALALLGFFFITLSMDRAGITVPLTFSALNTAALSLDPLWLKTGFIFVLIGFGTKMGLAPMHTWLPDAHSEAPSPASALLSGALLNCAFLGIYKVHCLMHLAGLGDFSRSLLIALGLLSILVAGIFLLNQPDYKRMLAYSSIENMGVIAFGVGIGGLGLYGALLHLIPPGFCGLQRINILYLPSAVSFLRCSKSILYIPEAAAPFSIFSGTMSGLQTTSRPLFWGIRLKGGYTGGCMMILSPGCVKYCTI